jgi:hypothetical protein
MFFGRFYGYNSLRAGMDEIQGPHKLPHKSTT